VARILIIGDAKSPLIRDRALIGRRANHEIACVSANSAVLPGATVFSLPRWINRMRSIRQLAIPLLLRRVMAAMRPDLVHVHYAYQGLATNRLLGFHPLVVSVMGGDILPDQSYHGYRARLVRTLLDSADCITSKSEFLDAALENIGDYCGKVRRITWGIDLKQYNRMRDTSALRSKLQIDRKECVFFDPRLAQPLYSKQVILAAFARYLEQGPPAVLIVSELFGHRRYIALLRRRARELGIADRVRFVGRIDQYEMADYYALADVTISVPTSDGFPQTIYEAAASGSFLVVSDLPQYREAFSGGLMARRVAAGDDESLAAALLWVVNNPEARAEASQRGAAYAAKVADKRTQDDLVCKMYDELLAGTAARVD
jgi:glycosyltransferase involved in cell wall biosynthesis